MDRLEYKKNAALYYKEKHLGDFVEIRLKDNSRAMGIFTEITPTYDIYLKGNPGFASVIVDPTEIKKFFAKPNEPQRGGKNRT